MYVYNDFPHLFMFVARSRAPQACAGGEREVYAEALGLYCQERYPQGKHVHVCAYIYMYMYIVYTLRCFFKTLHVLYVCHVVYACIVKLCSLFTDGQAVCHSQAQCLDQCQESECYALHVHVHESALCPLVWQVFVVMYNVHVYTCTCTMYMYCTCACSS